VVSHEGFNSNDSFDTIINKVIKPFDVDLICLAGFMRILSDKFVDYWRDRMINIHPSLLPSFKGLDVQQRAIDTGVRFSGCTVHFVRRDMDTGPIIVQAAVPVLGNDDANTLAGRILKQEHKIYPLAVKLIAQGRITIKNERVLIDGAITPGGIPVNPEA